MEYLLVSSVIGAGYFLSKNNNNESINESFLSKINKNQEPNGNNIYESTRSIEIEKDQQKRANDVYKKSKNSTKTNYMIAGPPQPIFNKVDGSNNKLPIEFKNGYELKNEANDIFNSLKKDEYKPQIKLPINDVNIPVKEADYMATGGWEGISLTGNPINTDKFFHNNMVPFFGGSVKQNVDEYSNQAVLENFTGNMNNYQVKTELEQDKLFKPTANLDNPYGTSNLEGYNLDRYIVSNIRNNEYPVDPIKVGPGLNDGYTWKPSGGYQQADTRKYVLPPTTNEIRTQNNPKLSYKGRIIPGMHIAKPGKIGQVDKNMPDTFYVNTPDRLFTTTGQVTGSKQRPKILIKDTNRKTTVLKSRVGSAAPAHTGSKHQNRPKFKKPTKIMLKPYGPRNQQSTGEWTIGKANDKIPNDYGKSSLSVKPNARMSTEGKMQVTNISMPNKININPEQKNMKLRPTNKIINNGRIVGNFQGTGPRKPKVYDPNDVPRTTMKETNINNNRTGTFQNTGPKKPMVYDPNDVPRTTIKETNIDNNRTGAFQNTGPKKPMVYDPNDIPRTTIKETNIDNNRTGAFQNTGPKKPTVYDPNDILRTTIKETNIDNNRTGAFQNTGPRKPTVYDPNDVPRTTIKETNINNNRTGEFQNTGPRKPTVYDPNDVPRTTIKETNINNNRTGAFQNTGPKKPIVYDPTDVPRTTMKETNIKNKRTGTFNNINPNKPRVYNPNDIPKETVKQCTIVKDNMGNINNQKSGSGYINKKHNLNAKNTNRQNTSVHYVGDARGEDKGGYLVKKIKPKNTARQFTSDNEYIGNKGPGNSKKPVDYSTTYNATIKSIRENVAKGRSPAHQGPKEINQKENINLYTSRNSEDNNKKLENREIIPTKTYNSMPQQNQFGQTNMKDALPNEELSNRLDPNLLNAFRKNPYTQSLHSSSM